MPVSSGKFLRISVKASNPPADAPIPTIGKGFFVSERDKALRLFFFKAEVLNLAGLLSLISTSLCRCFKRYPPVCRYLSYQKIEDKLVARIKRKLPSTL